ncbi:MAG: hypothetical protein COV29_02520 [Candidatus Yanofskybacteria bacterium CG10_big_fil_rev_8_21_14_0_10_36_16]|uniref:Uncharacterized protein n=1 Tax=Candidatus Yanofskybacteria bacterium CG10_big_fil_rev_8_21_14_0_10_36_16 TaxID=1975096 RepID=A0A2J0Q7V6_9BACT|nr:MAG: hypothetical protein COV29_02520 [Candidatus Yanofskybacteria bacterium CG10_big_fil_rev_8_21_14_0_10_36_16]
MAVFDLIDEGGLKFYGSFKNKRDAEICASAINGEVRDYFVSIESFDRDTCKVKKWFKQKGFSVWR